MAYAHDTFLSMCQNARKTMWGPPRMAARTALPVRRILRAPLLAASAMLLAACSGAFFRVSPDEQRAGSGQSKPAPARAEPEARPPVPAALPEYVEPAAVASDSAGVARLTALAMVWQTVAAHHPWIAAHTDAWDGAVARALPAVRAAGDVDALASAAGTLLGMLQDPVTRVERTTAPMDAPGRVRAETRSDGGESTLLLTIVPGTSYSATDRATMRAALTGDLSRVVLDLRGDGGAPSPAAQAAVDVLTESTALVRSLIATSLPLGVVSSRDQRTTLDVARYPGDDGAVEVTRGAARLTRYDGGVLEPGASREARVRVLVDAGTALPRQVAALVASGRATVEGAADETLVVSSVRIPLGHGVYARIRTGDATFRGATFRNAPRPTLAFAAEIARFAGDTVAYPHLGARVLAGYRVWSIMRTRHAHRVSYDDDIDAAFERVIPRLEAAGNREQYGAALRDLVASFDDSQVMLERRAADGRGTTASAPIRVRPVEGRMIITAVGAGVSGVSIGTEITAVDGFPIPAWLLDHRRDAPASNDWTRARDLARALPTGMAGSIALTVRDATGPERAVTLARVALPDANASLNAPGPAPERTTPVSRVYGDIAYIDLQRANDASVDSLLAGTTSARAIVLDLRGTTTVSPATLLRRLGVQAEFIAARMLVRHEGFACVSAFVRDARRECSEEQATQSVLLRSPEPATYRGRLAVLVDERTQGGAERLALALESGANATLIGSTSAGAAAPVVVTRLPGNLSLRYPEVELRRADGGQLHRVGLTPTVETRPTVRGIRAGKDEPLDRAIAWMQALIDPPRRRR